MFLISERIDCVAFGMAMTSAVDSGRVPSRVKRRGSGTRRRVCLAPTRRRVSRHQFSRDTSGSGFLLPSIHSLDVVVALSLPPFLDYLLRSCFSLVILSCTGLLSSSPGSPKPLQACHPTQPRCVVILREGALGFSSTVDRRSWSHEAQPCMDRLTSASSPAFSLARRWP